MIFIIGILVFEKVMFKLRSKGAVGMHPSKGRGVAHSREVGTHVVEAEQGRT